MKKYLVQGRNYTSSDSSHRVSRYVIYAESLELLCDQLSDQREYDILAIEEVSKDDPINCELDNHLYCVMYNKATCKICGKEFVGDYEI